MPFYLFVDVFACCHGCKIGRLFCSLPLLLPCIMCCGYIPVMAFLLPRSAFILCLWCYPLLMAKCSVILEMCQPSIPANTMHHSQGFLLCRMFLCYCKNVLWGRGLFLPQNYMVQIAIFEKIFLKKRKIYVVLFGLDARRCPLFCFYDIFLFGMIVSLSWKK